MGLSEGQRPAVTKDSVIKNERAQLVALASDFLPREQKVITLRTIHQRIFHPGEGLPLSEARAGQYLHTTVELFTDPSIEPEVKDTITELMDKDTLLKIADESAHNRWNMENTEGALNAFCTFMTINKLYGEKKGRTVTKALARKMVQARTIDPVLETANKAMSSQQGRDRGVFIYASAKGAELAQVTAQQAFLHATSEHGNATAVISPYYRDQFLTLNIGADKEDPNGNLMSIEETLAEMLRVEGAPRGAGREAPAKGKNNKDGKISIYPGYLNIGGNIAPASGFADQLRFRAITEQGITYDTPSKHDAYRDIQLDSTNGAVLVSLGDGAIFQLERTLELQANNRTPVVNLIQNNGIAIGVQPDEVLANTELWKKGHGAEIPGIRIEADDAERLYLATWFATQRALKDAGPSIVEIMTTRLSVHNTQHNEYLPTDPALEAHHEEPVDPVSIRLNQWVEEGRINIHELSYWEKTARERVTEAVQEVRRREGPDKKDVFTHIWVKSDPQSEREPNPEQVTLTGAAALRRAMEEAMAENPNVLIFGTDVHKGWEVKHGRSFQTGGYFTQQDGLLERFGKQPHRITNTAIAEGDVIDFLFGLATGAPDSADSQLRVLYDPQYSDYGYEGVMPSFHKSAAVSYSTEGKVIRPLGVLMMSGAAPGGGSMHSHEMVSRLYQTPSSTKLFYASNPETMYKLLKRSLLYENNPYLFMVSKNALFTPETFELGTGLMEPGRARVVKPGKDTQFITFGPMNNTINQALSEMTESGNAAVDDVGILDLVSIRPFPFQDMQRFLSGGTGPIVVAHQEPKYAGFGAQIISLIQQRMGEQLGREIVWLGGGENPVPPCDGILLSASLPTKEDVKNIIAGNRR